MMSYSHDGIISMKRAQIQIDDPTYRALRKRAYERGVSISSVVRETLAEAFGTRPTERRRLDDWGFVGVGRSKRPRGMPVSENHDVALAEAIRPRRSK